MARHALGMTQEEMAKFLGICRRSMIYYEMGESRMPVHLYRSMLVERERIINLRRIEKLEERIAELERAVD